VPLQDAVGRRAASTKVERNSFPRLPNPPTISIRSLAGLGISEYEPGRASDRAVLAELIPALLAGVR
jgi:hypothetical protein